MSFPEDTALLHTPEPSYPFRSVSHDASRESWGIGDYGSQFGWPFTATSQLSVLSLYINCCPEQKEASPTKAERGAKPRAHT